MESTITQCRLILIECNRPEYATAPSRGPLIIQPPIITGARYTRGAFYARRDTAHPASKRPVPHPVSPVLYFFFFLSLFISPSHSAHLVTESHRFVSFSRPRDGPPVSDTLDTSGSYNCPPPPPNRAHLV